MKELYKALMGFQQEVPNIYKNSQGYGYKFADLGEINDVIKPLLKKYGLGYVQPLADNAVTTVIFHVESGESITGTVTIPQGVQLAKMNDFQVMGSAITYLRRYSLSSMLGLITDEDADAAGEQVKAPVKKETRNRTEEVAHGAEPFNEEADALGRAKIALNEQMEKQGYTLPTQKKAIIHDAIGKTTIDNLNDADAIADALDNLKDDETEPGINIDGTYNK